MKIMEVSSVEHGMIICAIKCYMDYIDKVILTNKDPRTVASAKEARPMFVDLLDKLLHVGQPDANFIH